LGNDRAGDCVFAGAAHEHMLWTLMSGGPRAHFTTRDVFSDYSAVTGFNPLVPATDQGTDVQQACAYRQKTGIIDTTGIRHKIDAYAALRASDLDQLAQAVWIFGAAGVGVQFPASAEGQFNTNQPWSVVPGDKVNGGHYVPCVGRLANGNFAFITWGRLQEATPPWVKAYMDEGVAFLSHEVINNSTKVSPENFDLDLLNSYIARI
jgi:hypothetical protein